jgi:hypothetical protein
MPKPVSRLQLLAEVPAMARRIIDRIAARPVRPDRDFGYVRAGGLRAFPVRQQIRGRDAYQLGYLAKLSRSPEARPSGTQHDHATVVEQQFTVAYRPVAQPIAYPLGEAEHPDQPIHRGGRVPVQEIRNDLRICAVTRHDHHVIAGLTGLRVRPESPCVSRQCGGGPSRKAKEVMEMHRYQLVLDMDLLAMDEEHDLEPIKYLVAKHEQGPCGVIVLSLVDMSQTKLPATELRLGAQAGKFPVAPQADHDISAAAEHRMSLAVRHLRTIGCQASGVVSDQDLVKAVRSEAAGHDYDEVILATGRHKGSGPARFMGWDPVQQLPRKWGERLSCFRTAIASVHRASRVPPQGRASGPDLGGSR